MDEHIKKLLDQYKQAAAEETPYDVANGERGWTQADCTPGMDQLANEIGAAMDEEKQQADEIERLRAEKRLRELYPRVFKLMDKGKYFVVVAFDEPYFLSVYSMIREQEIKIGRWDAEDEKVYQFFQKEDE